MIGLLAAFVLAPPSVFVLGNPSEASAALIHRAIPTARVSDNAPKGPGLILVCPTTKQSGDIDDLVPRMRTLLTAIKAKSSSTVAVCLPVLPPGPMPVIRVEEEEGEQNSKGREAEERAEKVTNLWCIPSLLRQAAREAGVAVVDLETESQHGTDLVSLRDAIEGLAPEDLVAKRAWHLVRFTSQQADEGPAYNAIDGNPATYWHSQYDPKLTRNPHELVVDLGSSQTFGGVWYLPRQDGGDNGVAKHVAVYVSSDGSSWGDAVLTATLPRGIDRRSLRFAQNATARYFRFVILDAQNGGPYASAAEIGLLSSQ